MKVTGSKNEESLMGRLRDLIEGDDCAKLVLNLSQVQFLGSSALNQLVVLDKRVKQKGGEWKICSPRREVSEILNITRLDSLFSIAETQEAALAAMQA